MTDSALPAPNSPEQSGLLNSCLYLARTLEETQLVAALGTLHEPADGAQRKQFFDQVLAIVRQAGLRPQVARLNPEQLRGLQARLPVIVELQNGKYQVLTAINRGTTTEQQGVVTLLDAQDDHAKEISIDVFIKMWTGGVLLYEQINTALVCFSLIVREHKIELTQDRLVHEYGLSRAEMPQKTLLQIARDHELKAKVLRIGWKDLVGLKKAWPAMARLKNGRHIVLVGITQNQEGAQQIAVYDPLSPSGHIRMLEKEFCAIWAGEVYLFKRNYKITDEQQPFSLRWFIPEFLRQKVTFFDVGVAVLFINLISLVTPIFFQIVIDKVLVNQAFTTLHVLGIGMSIALLINAGLDFLRDYLLLHATNKIDLRITNKTFRHLLYLPLDFFEHMTAGVLTQHMQQTAKIRSFLSGSVFLTLLEASSLFIFLPFLFFYSVRLTGIVLVFTSMIALVIALLIRPFRQRLNALYEAEAKRQAMLVETIHGIPTVKAMAIEPLLRSQWEQKVAAAVKTQFNVGKISITARSLTQFLERIMTVVLIWMGASLVFNGSMTVGSLIAFQMLASRVTSPLVRLVGLIHQYQEAALSVEKLGIVMNAKEEWGADRHGASPSLKGDILFDRVSFRYGPDLPNVLHEISLRIPSGSMLGIVGPSGSGKTTLTRMLQKVYFPSTGTIRINDCYLNELDTAHLRRHLGVVLQENFLFRATVADNIRAGQSAASREEIIHASLLAGADEFVVNLPQGYDTMLEEGAKNLSGGQRQRLAIARALLTKPEILILDEATSALDPESERIIRENLADIAKDRTVLVVSHRLSMLKDADSIIVLERGYLVGHGPHAKLMADCALYKKLWQQQMEL